MKQRTVLIQAGVCLAILAAVQSGIHTKDDKFGEFLEKVAEVVQENYTLAELLNLTEDAAATIVSAPAVFSEAVIGANEKGMFGEPIDEFSEDEIRQVYAAAGGKVLRTGIRSDMGMYVMIEHPDSSFGKGKISTYGNLKDVTAVTGDRVRKGDIIGSFDSTGEKEFYFVLEEKS